MRLRPNWTSWTPCCHVEQASVSALSTSLPQLTSTRPAIGHKVPHAIPPTIGSSVSPSDMCPPTTHQTRMITLVFTQATTMNNQRKIQLIRTGEFRDRVPRAHLCKRRDQPTRMPSPCHSKSLSKLTSMYLQIIHIMAQFQSRYLSPHQSIRLRSIRTTSGTNCQLAKSIELLPVLGSGYGDVLQSLRG